jgi:hypothetical protein
MIPRVIVLDAEKRVLDHVLWKRWALMRAQSFAKERGWVAVFKNGKPHLRAR